MSKSDEFTILHSKLSGRMIKGEDTIDVRIFREDNQSTWVLWVVHEDGRSGYWDKGFATEQAAMDELEHTIEIEGMAYFLSDPDETKH
jgi:hypothetical protein